MDISNVEDDFDIDSIDIGENFASGARKDHCLAWKNITYQVKDGKNPFNRKKKRILHDVSGFVPKGKTLAILGPSGAGKSTLLEVLAQRRKNSQYTGKIRLNQQRITQTTFNRCASFVNQADIFMPTVTVNEQLQTTAALRVGSRLDYKERDHLVKDLTSILHLNDCNHTYIGSETIKGISGGEKKRVSIAVELLADPDLLLIDEPTSGLDASLAYEIMKVITNLTHRGKTVIVTIHQPRYEIWSLVDLVMLMTEGKVAYFGKAEDAEHFFSAIQFPSPLNKSPAEHFLDLLRVSGYAEDKDVEKSEMDRVKLICHRYGHSRMYKEAMRFIHSQITSGSEEFGDDDEDSEDETPNSSLLPFKSSSSLAKDGDGSELSLSPLPATTATVTEIDDDDSSSSSSANDKTNSNEEEESIQSERNSDSDSTSTTTSKEEDRSPSPALSNAESSSSILSHKKSPKAKKKSNPISHLIQTLKVFLLRSIDALSSSYPAPWLVQFTWLFTRAGKNVIRDPLLLMNLLVQYVFVAVFTGLVYLKVSEAQDVFAAIFFVYMLAGFTSLYGVVLYYPAERKVFNRERAAHSYSVSAYYLATTLANFPMYFLGTVLFMSVIYWMVPFSYGWATTFEQFGIAILFTFVFESLGFTIAAISPGYMASTLLASVVGLLWSMTGGFFVNIGRVKYILAPFVWTSPFKYGMIAASRVDLEPRTFPCDNIPCMIPDMNVTISVINATVPAVMNVTTVSNVTVDLANLNLSCYTPCLYPTGKAMLSALDLDGMSVFTSCMILVGMFLGFRVLGYLGLNLKVIGK